jgi:hypothetical protein
MPFFHLLELKTPLPVRRNHTIYFIGIHSLKKVLFSSFVLEKPDLPFLQFSVYILQINSNKSVLVNYSFAVNRA